MFEWIPLVPDLTETEIKGLLKLQEIYASADLSDGDITTLPDGDVTLEDLQIEIQYQFDHEKFFEFLMDLDDDKLGNLDDQIWDAIFDLWEAVEGNTMAIEALEDAA